MGLALFDPAGGWLKNAMLQAGPFGVRQSTIRLSVAQIQALFTTPIQAVPAPTDPNCFINPCMVVAHSVFGGAAYNAVNLGYIWGANTATQLNFLNSALNAIADKLATAAVSITQGQSPNLYTGQPLMLRLNGAPGNTGNGTVAVRTYYTVDQMP